MSAYVVGSDHITAMLTAAFDFVGPSAKVAWYVNASAEEQLAAGLEPEDMVRKELTHETADGVGQMLIDENVKSVSFRYPGESFDTLPGPIDKSALVNYEYTRSTARLTPVIVLKAIDCYAYQSCEHDGWDTSEARAFCDALRHKMIQHLDGYNDAPWEITREYATEGWR